MKKIDREKLKGELEELEGRAREASSHVHTGDMDLALDELDMLIGDASDIRKRLAAVVED